MFKKRVFEFMATENITINNSSFRSKILANIYKYINKIDNEISSLIHDTGYRYKKNQYYKPFTTYLDLGNDNFIYKDKILIRKGVKVKFVVSGMKKYVDIISEGIMVEDLLNINNKLFMFLQELDISDKKLTSGVFKLKTLAPVSITTKDEKNKKRYIPIRNTEIYFQKLYEGLCRKYEAFYGESYKDNFQIKYLSNIGYKGHKIEIKKVKNNSGDLISHNEIMYSFSILIGSNDEKMINLIKYIGLGGKNAYGFGYVDILEV